MQREGSRVAVSAAMTLDHARYLLEQGSTQVKEGATLFDLGAVAELDSSCLAVVFGWQRAAGRAGSTIRIVNPPANLLSLAELYGVAELLPLAK
jgi:phospholipid transport system transporter-binding protein